MAVGVAHLFEVVAVDKENRQSQAISDSLFEADICDGIN